MKGKAFRALLVAPALLFGCKHEAVPEVRLAAASDLSIALNELGPAFEKASGFTIKTTLGSSGQLAEQLRQGAPFDAFASANRAFALRASEGGTCDSTNAFTYAMGRIAFVSHEGSPVGNAQGLLDAGYKKIAIAHPDHAPYGRAAKEALQHAGVWGALLPKLVFAENVQQALQWVDRGDADAGIVADSMAGKRARTLVPRDAYQPLEQTFITCNAHGNTQGALALHAFMKSEQARTILSRNGFDLQ